MIILNGDGTLTAEGVPEHLVRRRKETIEVPEDLIAQQSDLLDRIFAFAFDVLGLQSINVRIRPAILDGSPGALDNVPAWQTAV
jgi:hypothetical protein